MSLRIHTSDLVYCEVFFCVGVDSMCQHATPSIVLLAEKPVVELIDVTLLEIFKAEVGAEESRGAILQERSAARAAAPASTSTGPMRVRDD